MSTLTNNCNKDKILVDNVILYSPRQKGNPLLDHIKNFAVEVAENQLPDYVLGSTTCALYISLRYQRLHPNYLIGRIEESRRDYRNFIILCYVDQEDNTGLLLELNKLACRSDSTLILAWSLLEAAKYLETYKAYEKKPASSIQEKVESDFLPKLTSILTSIKSVNKSDVITLLNTFGSLQRIMTASIEELALCPGLGERKVKRIYEAFYDPFTATNELSHMSQSKE